MKTSFKLLLPLLLLALPAVVHAQFTFTTNNGAITITGYTGTGGAVTIPDTTNGWSVTSIGDGAFYNCISLTNITISTNVTSIGDLAFYGSANLTSVTIPSSVTNLGAFAFYDCTSLASATIPGSVTSIGDATFYDCASLTNAVIGNGITNIAELAFYGCGSLASVTIPGSVSSLGDQAFGGCTNLSVVNFQGNAPNVVGVDVFYGDSATVYYMPGTTGWGPTLGGLPTGLFVVPCFSYMATNGTITITQYTCSGNAVTIPSTINGLPVTSIGDSAFYNCTNLTNVTIAGSVTSIGDIGVQFVHQPGQRDDPQKRRQHRELCVRGMRTVDHCDDPRQRHQHRVWRVRCLLQPDSDHGGCAKRVLQQCGQSVVRQESDHARRIPRGHSRRVHDPKQRH